MWLVVGRQEVAASDATALEAVMAVDEEKVRLEKEAESIANQEGPEVEARLEDIYERFASAFSWTSHHLVGPRVCQRIQP